MGVTPILRAPPKAWGRHFEPLPFHGRRHLVTINTHQTGSLLEMEHPKFGTLTERWYLAPSAAVRME